MEGMVPKEQYQNEKKELAEELVSIKKKHEKEKVDLQNKHDDDVKKMEESVQKYRKKWTEADKKVWGLQTSLNEAIKNHNHGIPGNPHNDEVKRLEESAQNYRNKWTEADKKVWGLQRSLNEASSKMETVEQELKRITRERNFFERMATENASPKSSDKTLNLIPQSPQTPGKGKPTTSSLNENWVPPPSFVYPQISPLQGVDPFAILKSCDGARRKLSGSVATHLERLRIAYEKCNKRRLTDQTLGLFDTIEVKMCGLCNVQVHPVGGFIDHICGKKHTKKLNGAACADAFDFWWKAVETATFDEPQSSTAKIPQTKSELKEWKKENERTKEMMEKYKNECNHLKKSLEEVSDRLESMEKEKETLKAEAEKERERFAQLEKEMEEMKLFWADLGGGVVRKKPRTDILIKEEPADDMFGNEDGVGLL